MDRFKDREMTPDLGMFEKGINKLPGVLSSLGFTSLRKGQDQVVMNFLAGMDTIAILPTSLGKSACYVVPTLCHDWFTIVISPLVALMRDQVLALQAKGIEAGQISSSQTEGENLSTMKDWVDGKLKILYIAPERLNNSMFLSALKARKPDFVAVDEAHCISSWGHNFRPSYKLLGDALQELAPKVVGAFSATCPPKVEKDVRWVLGMEKAKRILHFPRRENLKLTSAKLDHELDLVAALKKVTGPTIVYFSTIKRLEETMENIRGFIKVPITCYFGELSPQVKRTNQDLFMQDKSPIIFATPAFGMGIDKPNVRHVIVRDIPGTLEDLSQQLGRAGRDGNDSYCHTFLSQDSIRTQQFFIRMGNPDTEDIVSFYQTLERLADKSGIIEESTYNIGKIFTKAGGDSFMISSLTSILLSDNVIQRVKEKSTAATIRYHKWLEDNKRFMEWYEAVCEGGVKTGEKDCYEIDLPWLTEKLGFKGDASVRKWLKQWEFEGLISFTPPASKAPLQLIGSLGNVDFERLQIKSDDAKKRLNEVIDYTGIPDDEKHSYMEHVFKMKNSE